MGEYISREAALTVLDWDCASQDALNAIKAIPAADVVEVRHGQWEYIGGYGYQFRCSECILCAEYKTKYCPSCGAKMDGGQDE